MPEGRRRRHRGRGAGQVLRRRARARRRRPARPAGTVLGLLGPERGGQDDRGPHPHHALPADGGTARVAGLDVGDRSAAAAPAASASPASTRRSTKTSPASRTCRWSAGSTTCPKGEPKARAPSCWSASTSRDAGGAPGPHLLRRDAAAARPRCGPGRAAAGPLPRRADHRAGPAQPHRPLGDDRRPRRRRDDESCSPPSTSTRPTGSPTASR